MFFRLDSLQSDRLAEILVTIHLAGSVNRLAGNLIPIPCHEITDAEGSIAQLREHNERMAPGICVKAFQAAAGVHNLFVAVVAAVGQVPVAQLLPHLLGRVEFG